MRTKFVVAVLVGLLITANTAGFYSHNLQSPETIKDKHVGLEIQPENTVNIGEVFAEMCGFGFINHELYVYDKEVEWKPENGIVNGKVEMNYSLFYLFDKKLPRFMATGFSIYHGHEKIGGNHIFTMSKNSKSIRGTFFSNISLEYEADMVLTVRIWFWCFPPHPLDAIIGDPSSHGLLNWLSLGAFDIKTVNIHIKSKGMEKCSEDVWAHTGCDIQNTGFKRLKGRGDISSYRLKMTGFEHVLGMGAGEPKVADVDGDGKTEVIFGTQRGFLYSMENGKKIDWRCDLDAPLFYMSLELGDINGDGKYEIISPSESIFESENSGLRIVNGEGEVIAWWKNPEGGFPLGDPRAADIDGDGKDEILVGLLGDDKRGNDLYALSYENGKVKILWRYQTYSWVQWPAAVGDIDNDGEVEVVFSSHDMCVYCLNSDGVLKWKYVTNGGLQPIYSGGFRRILFEPVIYDINGDGYMEICVDACLYDKPELSAVYCLDRNGNLIWKYRPGNSIFGRPSVGDMNNDEMAEIVFGDNKGNIYALDNKGDVLWKKSFPQIYFKRGIMSGATPQSEFNIYMVDLDGKGNAEIVAVAFCHGIFILSSDGKLIKQWPRPFGLHGYRGAAVADIDGDGDLEIVFGVAGKTGIFGRLGIIDQG